MKNEKPDLYVENKEFNTVSFRVRKVGYEDAKDLLLCYSDKAAVARMNADRCEKGFYLSNPY